MGSAQIVPAADAGDEAYQQQWAREDSVLDGVTAADGRPRHQKVHIRQKVTVTSPRFWKRNKALENTGGAVVFASSRTPR